MHLGLILAFALVEAAPPAFSADRNVHPSISISIDSPQSPSVEVPQSGSTIELTECDNGCDLEQLREILGQYAGRALEISLTAPSGVSHKEAAALLKKIIQAAPQGSPVQLLNLDVDLMKKMLDSASKAEDSSTPEAKADAQNRNTFFQRFKERFQNWQETARKSWADLTSNKKDLFVAAIKSGGGIYVFITTGKGGVVEIVSAVSSLGVDTFFGLFGVKYPEFKRNFAFFNIGKGNSFVEWAKGKTWAKAIGIDMVVSTLIQGYFRFLMHLQDSSTSSPASLQWLGEHVVGNICGILMGAPAEQSVLEMNERKVLPQWAKWTILQGWNILGSVKGWLVATPYGATPWGGSLLASLIVVDSATKLTTIGVGMAFENVISKKPRIEIRIKASSPDIDASPAPELSDLMPPPACSNTLE